MIARRRCRTLRFRNRCLRCARDSRRFRRPWRAVLLLFLAGCSTMQSQKDLRAERIEQAVVPMARAALEAGQVETARRLYTRLRDAAPSAPAATMGLGDVELAAGRPARAASWYQQAVLLAETPADRHAALLAHGRANVAVGDLDAARDSFARLVDPDEAAPPALAAWGHNGLAVVAILDGDPRSVVAAVQRAVDLAPDERRFRDNLQRALAIADAHLDAPNSFAGSPARGVAPASGVHTARPDRGLAAEPFPPDDANEIAVTADAAAEAESAAAKTESSGTEAAVAEIESAVAEAPARAPVPVRDVTDKRIAADATAPATRGHDADVLPPEPVRVEDVPMPVPVEEVEEDVAQAPVPADPPVPAEPLTGTPPVEGAGRAIRPPAVGFVVRDDSGDYLQVGAFAVEANAGRLAERLGHLTDLPVRIEPPGEGGLYRVRIGPLAVRDELPRLRAALSARPETS